MSAESHVEMLCQVGLTQNRNNSAEISKAKVSGIPLLFPNWPFSKLTVGINCVATNRD